MSRHKNGQKNLYLFSTELPSRLSTWYTINVLIKIQTDRRSHRLHIETYRNNTFMALGKNGEGDTQALLLPCHIPTTVVQQANFSSVSSPMWKHLLIAQLSRSFSQQFYEFLGHKPYESLDCCISLICVFTKICPMK